MDYHDSNSGSFLVPFARPKAKDVESRESGTHLAWIANHPFLGSFIPLERVSLAIMLIRRVTSTFLVFLVLSLIAQIHILKIHALTSSESVCSDHAARSTCGGADKLAGAQEQINRYLETEEGAKGDFYIQGWRWHTLSLAREARRLQKVAEKMYSASGSGSQSEPLDLESIKSAADYIVGFNMKGLHKIERDLFFPWARKKVEDLNQPAIGQAFGALMDHLEGERQLIADLGNDLVSLLSRTKTFRLI